MKEKLLGSETFGTTQVKTDEYLLLAQTMIENGHTVEESAVTISAIDDMLSMQKIQCIINEKRFTAKGRIRKDSSLLDMLSKRLDQLIVELKIVKKERSQHDR